MADDGIEKKLGLTYLVEVRVGRNGPCGVDVVLDAVTSQEQTCSTPARVPTTPTPHPTTTSPEISELEQRRQRMAKSGMAQPGRL